MKGYKKYYAISIFDLVIILENIWMAQIRKPESKQSG